MDRALLGGVGDVGCRPSGREENDMRRRMVALFRIALPIAIVSASALVEEAGLRWS
jgi:hypothetical protein